VAVDGKIYLLTLANNQEVCSALDAKTGEVLWAQGSPAGQQPAGGYGGTRATPAVANGRIYTYGQAGDLVARDVNDGRQLWHLNIPNETRAGGLVDWGTASSPLVVGDLVCVQTGGTGGPVAVAVDKNTGKLAWQSQARGKSGYAAVVYADVEGKPQLLIFGGNALYGIDPATGQTLWQEPWPSQYDVNAATPVYRDGCLFVTSAYNTGRCAMFRFAGGKPKKLWEKRDITCRFQPPVLDGDVLFANSEGTLKCMSWPDGKILWQQQRDLRLGVGGSLLRCAAGDRLVTMGDRGQLSLLQATPKGVKGLSQVELFEADQIWSTPLLYDGKLYAKGRDNLVCLDVSDK
jgi:outer membrane protein assembly factor BamB